MKIIEAYEAYRDERMVTQNRSYSTMSQLTYHRNSMVKFFGNVDIETLTIEELTSYIRWLIEERCSNTVRNYATSLKLVLKNCRLHGLDCVNPDLIPIAKREEVKTNFVTPDEVASMISAASTIRQKLIISLLFSSGVRVSELCNIKKSDIRGDVFTVKGKGRRIRLCFIDSRTSALLNAYLLSRQDDCPYLIISSRFKTKVTPSTVQFIVRRIRQKAGIAKNVTPHAFRHGFATDLLENGAAIQDVSEMLGHASVQTTMIYRHISNPGLHEKYQKAHSF